MERKQTQKAAPQVRPQAETQEVAAKQVQYEGLDDLLSDIDSVLESHAEEFVAGFVQKGMKGVSPLAVPTSSMAA